MRFALGSKFVNFFFCGGNGEFTRRTVTFVKLKEKRRGRGRGRERREQGEKGRGTGGRGRGRKGTSERQSGVR